MEIVEARVERLEAGRARRANAMAAGERTVNTAASLSVGGSSIRPRSGARAGAKAASRRPDDVAGPARVSGILRRRDKPVRVATVSASAIAEPPAATPPTRPDIQPCANGRRASDHHRHRHRPAAVRASRCGGGQGAAGVGARGRAECRPRAVVRYGNGDEDVPFLETVGNPVAVSPERGSRPGARRRGWPVLRC
jgi:hypothetical protein